MFAELLTLAAIPASLDAFMRTAFAWRSLRVRRAQATDAVSRWLVAIPARDEGLRVEATLRALRDAAAGAHVERVLILDGEDAVAAAIAAELGAEVVVKEPPGPSKAAALAWFAGRIRERAMIPDAILVLDVGSRVSSAFFSDFGWPAGADAVQVPLSGEGDSVGRAVAASERAAQHFQDRGRSAFGWNVQLRGTGMAFRTEVFQDVFPRLGTRIEDLEATLWLSAEGKRIEFPTGSAVVYDVKPSGMKEAAVQRSRWLAGRLELLVRRAPWIGRLLVRSPVEGMAMVTELLSRPIALTALLRLGAASALVLSGGGMRVAVAVVLALTVAMDAIYLGAAQRIGWRDAARLTLAWLGALVALPLAFVRWMRSRRS